jgi:hypothetical protein
MNSITYFELKATCDTGDILLFNTRRYWYDRLIEKFTYSKFSHVGVILKDPYYLSDNCKIGIFLLESGRENFTDVSNNDFIYGVQVVDLDKVVNGYVKSLQTDQNMGNLYYRKLKCERNKDFFKICEQSIKQVYNSPYDLLPQDWIKSELHNYNGDSTKIQRLNTFWCSALASYLYTKLDFISHQTPWTLIQPTQFSFYEGRQLKLNDNITLEPEILVI